MLARSDQQSQTLERTMTDTMVRGVSPTNDSTKAATPKPVKVPPTIPSSQSPLPSQPSSSLLPGPSHSLIASDELPLLLLMKDTTRPSTSMAVVWPSGMKDAMANQAASERAM